ncbi:DEAD/DEAH box helicase [Pseudomonas kairouanensis]|uniref:DEAD/DEAH box helicase n=1 Tax=Pseudomonas kairouanensis TaxID=2293832 RepID=A0A4Z0AMN6_9PSED|nr:DEAD/DEAH box helicase [Pseudomonas kairouanensis]TFY87218.1 DEAD/DEAH box helicase [Pseudomonas kairouanensis]
MNLPPSHSDSSGFEQLEPRIQRWIWAEGWTSLRDAQEWAVPVLVRADQDVIIAAATAAGKTEAAFLPILTNLLNNDDPPGAVLYISPLKALINDQWDRLSRLCEQLEIPVVAWHGDVSSSKKHRFLKSSEGVLLITPESLEALFVNRGSSLGGVFQHLRYIVVDELHAFIGSERGKQLQSLMHRVELAAGRRLPRVGLSATLGDMKMASAFLRPANADNVTVIESKNANQTLQVQVRGYIQPPMSELKKKPAEPNEHEGNEDETENEASPDFAIAEHLYKVLRGSNNLIFPNSRSQVEWYADQLRRRCEKDGVPNEFWPHHGSLSKDLREQAEHALKAGDRPASAICTTTLELGIDIGSIKTVVQIGAPPSVASLRQRLGRSGRRPGEKATLRVYCKESPLTEKSSLSDQLRQGLVQTIAMVRLLARGWFEPPRAQGIHASTLVQQCLSIIAQCGGASAADLWKSLIDEGAFPGIEKSDFVKLLKSLGGHELIVQDSSGLLLPGTVGERMINHYEFYSAFTSDEEFRLVCDGKALGSVPVSRPLTKDQRIIFGGRRWQVRDVDLQAKVIIVSAARGGAPPQFDGLGAMVHDAVREEMRAVLVDSSPCPFIDQSAKALLDEARKTFALLGLGERYLIESSGKCYLISWLGDYANDALRLLLNHVGLSCDNSGLAIEIDASIDQARNALADVGCLDPSDLDSILSDVENMLREKWDWTLPETLLMKSFASISLDISNAVLFAKKQQGK